MSFVNNKFIKYCLLVSVSIVTISLGAYAASVFFPVHNEPVSNSPFDDSVAQVEEFLEKNLKNPDSLEIVEWGKVRNYTPDEPLRYIVWCKYRAKNSFGGFVVEKKNFIFDGAGKIVEFRDRK
ncbi:hypothetical protein [Maridesulfovibrio sp.]|uniref:hypothetical protein n=1 Tax=Maridesulfovibrio sp. TaxID=2795000 RepID=UPI0039F02B45